MSDELLVEHTARTLKNCSRIRTPAATYDEAIQLYAAELAKRLSERGPITILSEHDPETTKIVIQPIGIGESCVSDVISGNGTINGRVERYEIRRTL